jgi:5-(carboxyamino)imidazole ribonucleotide mutase
MSLKVAMLMGSKSDLPKLVDGMKVLDDLGIDHEVRIMSAHRTPDVVMEFASKAADKGFGVIVAAAGGAAHLAGVVASHTLLPVIGIPVEGGALNGLDALLSTVQMPGGIPVATVGIGKGGPVNAALLAAQILAVTDADVRKKLDRYRKSRRESVISADKDLRDSQ